MTRYLGLGAFLTPGIHGCEDTGRQAFAGLRDARLRGRLASPRPVEGGRRDLRMSSSMRPARQVCIHHDFDQLFEGGLGFPSEPLLGLGIIAH